MGVTSLNATKYLVEQLLLVHLSTSHIALGNAGHFEVKQELILQFEHIIPNEQPIQPWIEIITDVILYLLQV